MVLRAPTTRRVFTAALMLVLAGAAGNLWDNLFMEPPSDHPYGEVRDFIDVYFPSIGERGWHFPTFNVADSCITVGAVLLLLSGFGKSDKEETAPAESEPTGESSTATES
jgi:signal peptidase II